MSYEITRLAHDEPSGAIIGMYCAQCRRTTFTWSPYAVKPEDGDLYMFSVCADQPLHNAPRLRTYSPAQFYDVLHAQEKSL